MEGRVTGESAGWYVLTSVGLNRYAFNADSVCELIQARKVTYSHLPLVHDAIRGLLNHRGVVLPLVELRPLVGELRFEDEVEEMRAFIAGREQDHISWLEDLRICASSGTDFKKALDPKLCAFGKWYESLRNDVRRRHEITTGNAVLEKIFEDFDGPHRRIHAIATRVLNHAKLGEIAEAEAIIQSAWETDLAAMKVLFKKFFELFAEIRRPSILVAEYEGERFGLLVDRVYSVQHCDEDCFEDSPDLAVDENTLSQQCMRTQDGLALVVDLSKIVGFVAPAMAA